MPNCVQCETLRHQGNENAMQSKYRREIKIHYSATTKYDDS